MAEAIRCVTGATDGIGFVTALKLATPGALVLVHGRTEAKAAEACARLRAAGAAEVRPVWGDFGALAEVRALAAQVAAAAPALDVLVNNAGVFLKQRTVTADGHEATLQINHLAPYLLTRLLEGPLSAAPQGRVVNVSSMAHARGVVDLADLGLAKGYSGYAAYAASKLLNVHFTHELARRWAATRVTAAALHPGVIDTKLLRTGFGASGGSVEEGARTSVHCATAPELAQVTGRYFSSAKQVPCAPHANDPALERQLWELSARLCGLPA